MGQTIWTRQTSPTFMGSRTVGRRSGGLSSGGTGKTNKQDPLKLRTARLVSCRAVPTPAFRPRLALDWPERSRVRRDWVATQLRGDLAFLRQKFVSTGHGPVGSKLRRNVQLRRAGNSASLWPLSVEPFFFGTEHGDRHKRPHPHRRDGRRDAAIGIRCRRAWRPSTGCRD